MANNDTLINLIEERFAQTNKNIESMQSTIKKDIAIIQAEAEKNSNRFANVESELCKVKSTTDQLDEMRLNIESLKQDRLRNNLRLTGLPPVAFENTNKTIMQIKAVLKLGIIPSDFIVYSDRHGSSLILSFGNYAHKRLFTNELQRRKGLLVEEVFPTLNSNSAIYANDQLTPYFAKLFQSAWQAEKNGLLYSASSLGGRIKIKLNETSQSIAIASEQQLNEVLNGSHQNEAFTPQSDGSLESRNNNNNNNNGFISSDLSDKGDSTSQQQPQTQQSTNSNQLIHSNCPKNQLPSGSIQSSNHRNNIRVHMKIRSDLNKQRLDSRDRAYRSDFKFDDRQQPQSNSKQHLDSYPSRKRFPSPPRRVNKFRNRDNRAGYIGNSR